MFVAGILDTTIRVKFSLASHPELTTSDAVAPLVAQFGAIESSEIVMSLKPAPPKKPKRGNALVPFKQIGDAFAAVCASGRENRKLKDIEISWAEGKEPELIGWLKKMGKLGGTASADPSRTTSPTPTAQAPPTTKVPSPPTFGNGAAPFSSFPSSFVSCHR